METDDFWHLIETARSYVAEARTFDQALVDLLAARSQREVLEYQERFDELHGALYRWDVWAAAYLIGGGCSDDSFVDFRAGVIAEGRTWYERVVADPDSLAEHPVVAATAGAGEDYVLFYELVSYVAANAFEQLTGDEDDFYEAWEQYNWEAQPGGEAEKDSGAATDMGTATDMGAATVMSAEMDMGEHFDFHDAEQMHLRLPRLAALYLSSSARARP